MHIAEAVNWDKSLIALLAEVGVVRVEFLAIFISGLIDGTVSALNLVARIARSTSTSKWVKGLAQWTCLKAFIALEIIAIGTTSACITLESLTVDIGISSNHASISTHNISLITSSTGSVVRVKFLAQGVGHGTFSIRTNVESIGALAAGAVSSEFFAICVSC